jgi:hypothetical protein
MAREGFRKVSTTILRGAPTGLKVWSGLLEDHKNLTNHQIVIVGSREFTKGRIEVRIMPDTRRASNSVTTGRIIDLTGKDSAFVNFTGVIRGLHLKVLDVPDLGATISVVVSSFSRNRIRSWSNSPAANTDHDYVSSTLFEDHDSAMLSVSRDVENHRNLIYHQLSLHCEQPIAAGEYKVRFIPDDHRPLERSCDTGKRLIFTDTTSAMVQFGAVMRGIHLEPVVVASAGTTLTCTLSSSVERFDEVIHQYIGNSPQSDDHINDLDNPHQTSWDNLLNKPTSFPPDLHGHFMGDWEPQIYYPFKMVRDGSFLMQANVETADRPAPLPVGVSLTTFSASLTQAQFTNGDEVEFTNGDPVEFGSEEWLEDSDVSQVWAGHDYQFEDDGLIQQVRIWVPEIGSTITHRVVVIISPEVSVPRYEVYYPSGLIAGQWNVVELPDIMVRRGDNVRVFIDATNRVSETISTGNWLYEGASVDAPAATSWSHAGHTILKIHDQPFGVAFQVELASIVDMEVELASLVVMDVDISLVASLLAVEPKCILRFQDASDVAKYIEYKVMRGPVDMVTYVELHVTVSDVGEHGPTVGADTELFITVPVLGAVKYVRSPDNWLANQPGFVTIGGFLAYDGAEQVVSADDAHGVELVFQKHYWSSDWDIVHMPT